MAEYHEYEEEIQYFVILCTASGIEEGQKIARNLVEARLAACVNLVKNVVSIFTWKGAVNEAEECLLVIKTRTELIHEIIERIKSLHSYDVPEIIALPITDGNSAYLDWIQEATNW